MRLNGTRPSRVHKRGFVVAEKARILAIDDDAAILELVNEVLETDYEVTITNNPFTGLELLRRYRHNLLLLDLGLPELDGIELTRLVRLDSSIRDTPILVVSAYPDLTQLISAGRVEGYLPKPFTLDALVNTVASILHRAETRARDSNRPIVSYGGSGDMSPAQP